MPALIAGRLPAVWTGPVRAVDLVGLAAWAVLVVWVVRVARVAPAGQVVSPATGHHPRRNSGEMAGVGRADNPGWLAMPAPSMP